MKEPKKQTAPATPAGNRYKAANKKKFKACFNSKVSGYESLCKGESVSFDESSEMFKFLSENKLIVKE